MDTTTPVVLGSVTSWGSPSSSPALSASPGKSGDHRVKPQSPVASADTNLTAGQLRSPPTSVKMLQRENGGHSPGLSHTALSQGSPKSTSSPSVQTQPMARAWAIPTATAKPKETPGFPAATETLDQPKVEDKKTQKEDNENTERKGSFSMHMEGKWDEMEDEALDFSAPVLEFADGTTIKVQQKPEETESDGQQEEETVTPADRFTDDYDRSYPSQSKQHSTLFETGDARYSDRGHGYQRSNYDRWRSGPDDRAGHDHDFNSRYDRRGSYDRHDGRSSYERRDSRPSPYYHARRPSGDQWKESESDPAWRKSSFQRRPSQDSRDEFHPTLLQRPRRQSGVSTRSDELGGSAEGSEGFGTHSTVPGEIERPPEVTAAQKEVMLTAAERAKKRRDEEEAEYIAARERAKQKAMELAKLAEQSSTISSERTRQASTSSEKDSHNAKSESDSRKPSSSWASVARPINNKESGGSRAASHQESHASRSPERTQKPVSISDIDKVMSSIRQTLNEKKTETEDQQFVPSKTNEKAVSSVEDASSRGLARDSETKSEVPKVAADSTVAVVETITVKETKSTSGASIVAATETTAQFEMVTEPAMEHSATWKTIVSAIEPTTWNHDEANTNENPPNGTKWDLKLDDSAKNAEPDSDIENIPGSKQWKQYMKQSKEEGFIEKERSQPHDWSSYAKTLEAELSEMADEAGASSFGTSEFNDSEASVKPIERPGRGGFRGRGRGQSNENSRGRGRGGSSRFDASSSELSRGGRGRGRGGRGRGGRFGREANDSQEALVSTDDQSPSQINSRADTSSSWRRTADDEEPVDIEVRLPHRQKPSKPTAREKRNAETKANAGHTNAKSMAKITLAESLSSSTRQLHKKIIGDDQELDFSDLLLSVTPVSDAPATPVEKTITVNHVATTKTTEADSLGSANEDSASSDAGKKSSRKKPQRKKSSLTAAKTPLFPQTFDNVVGKRPSTMQFRFENDVDADKEPERKVAASPSLSTPSPSANKQQPAEHMNLVLTSTWGVSSPLSHSASPANQNSDIFLSKELSSQIDLDTSALVDNLVHGSGGDDTDSSPSFKNRSKGTHGASPHGQGRFAKGQYGMGRRHDGQQQRRVPMDHRMMGNSSFPIMMYPMAISSPAAGMHNNAVYVTSEQTAHFAGTPGQAQATQQQPFYLIPQQPYVSGNQFLQQQPFNQNPSSHSQGGNFLIPFGWQPASAAHQQRGSARPSHSPHMEHGGGFHKNKDKGKFKTPEMVSKGLAYDKNSPAAAATWQYQPRSGPVPLNQTAMVAGPPSTYFNNTMPSPAYGSGGGRGRGSSYNMTRPTRGGGAVGNHSRGGGSERVKGLIRYR
ncbi:hypothetical protein VKS41_007281 [Umbelopsis sp. WA50703]